MKLKNIIGARPAALICLLAVNNSWSIIESVSIYKAENSERKIIIISDADLAGRGHDLCSEHAQLIEQDKDHYCLLLQWILQLAASSSKSMFQLECIGWNIEEVRECKAINGYQSLMYELGILAKDNQYKVQNVSFKLDSSRPKCIAQFIIFINNFCLNLFDAIRHLQPREINGMALSCKVDDCSNETLEEMFKSLENSIMQMQEELVSIPLGFIWIELLDIQFNKFKNMLKKYDFNRPYVDVLLETINQSKENIAVELKQMDETLRETSHVLLQIGYIISLFNKNSANYDILVFCMSKYHALKLDKYLTKIYNLKSVLQESNLEKKDINRLKEILGVSESQNKCETRPLAIEQLENQIAKLGDNNCAKCQKNKCVNKCSRCKKVYYCSQACQRADWSTHKSNCAKVI